MTQPNAASEIPPEVRAAFTSASIIALQELAGIEAFADEPSSLAASLPVEVVAASICLQRPLPGTLTLILTCETASKLAARYLPAGTTLVPEIVDDVAGEFANVIAGQAKTILKGTPYHFTLSTPSVVRETQDFKKPTCEATRCLAVTFELGQMQLLVDLQACPGA